MWANYIAKAGVIDKEEYKKVILNSELSKEGGRNMLTLGEQYKLEGILEGKREGREEEKKFIAKKLLKSGAEIKTISNLIEMSEEEIAELKKELIA